LERALLLSTLLMLNIGALAGLSSCSTVKATLSSSKPKAGPAFHVLREGQRIEQSPPLPDRMDIGINWTYSNGEKTKESFRGWDFDSDGQFDMLEVVDHAGAPVSWAYDFDGDALIDVVELPGSRPSDEVGASESLAPGR
jgi:hypothetical protein